MNRNNNRRAYITVIAGMVAIGALVCIGVVTNEQPDMTVPLSPSPVASHPEPGSSYVKEPTKAVEVQPTKKPWKEPTVTKTPVAEPTKEVVLEVTKAPTAVPTITVTPVDDNDGGGQGEQMVSAEALAALSFDAERGLNWPVLGEVVLRFSMDHGIYHETLNSFRTSDGVLLAAEVGEPVVSTAVGIVTEIYEDTMRGICVTMALGDSYVVTYGQLADVTCKVGDKLAEGDRIGYVAAPTKYYSLEGAHVYFKVCNDGTPMNPLLLLRGGEE